MGPQDNALAAPGLDPRRWRTLALLGVAQFMLILDVTVVALALPEMGEDLGLSRVEMTWVVSAYTLVFGGLLLLGGRSADMFGSRRIVIIGASLFTAASMLTGIAGGSVLLISGRVAQGVAAALVSPAALSVVVKTFDGDERNRALGIWSALGGAGAAAGVLLGGLLTAGPGWRWVFFINVPVGAVVVVALIVTLAHDAPVARRQRLDLTGAMLVTAATAAAVYGVIAAGEHGLTGQAPLIWLAVAVTAYAAFILRQWTVTSPLMDLGLLTRRSVGAGTFLIVVATALMMSTFFLGTFYFQQHREYGPLVTGLLFLPVAAATIAGAQVAGRRIGAVGARTVAGVGLAVTSVGGAVAAIVDEPTALAVGITLAAAGIGATFVAASATALGAVAHHEAGIASGILSTFHEFGAAFGVAVTSSLAAGSIAGTDTAGFTRGFTFTAIVAAAAGVLSRFVVPSSTTPDDSAMAEGELESTAK